MNKHKKQEQEVINYLSKNLYDMAMNEVAETYGYLYPGIRKPLNKCQACVYETENFYILQSYSTIVAVIEKATNILSDVKFMNYDFKAANHTCHTTAQHITKFRHAYGKDKEGCKIEYTYR